MLSYLCRRTFAVSMCNKVSDMIQGQSTPANMKLQLIPILQYMHHDTNTASMVRKLCTDLLPSYPAKDFVLVTLCTLTQLAATTLVDIPNQVSHSTFQQFVLLGQQSCLKWTC